MNRKDWVKRLAIELFPPITVRLFRKVFTTEGSIIESGNSKFSTLNNPLEVPAQVEAYLLCRNKYLEQSDTVLDVGFGLGYGLHIMSAMVERMFGLEIDNYAIARANRIFKGHRLLGGLVKYDGTHLPFKDNSVDAISCIDVLEHVKEYKQLLFEMLRVARKVVFMSTPNRRMENTLPNGRPKNWWHLREWSYDELSSILQDVTGVTVDWNFIGGPWDGPFDISQTITDETMALTPALLINSSGDSYVLGRIENPFWLRDR